MFSLSPLSLWCLIFWSLLEAKDIAWQCPSLSWGSACAALPVPGMVGEKPLSHWARARRSPADNSVTALQRLCIIRPYMALSIILWNCCIRQDCMGSPQAVLEQQLGLSRLESCVHTDLAFQNETPICKIRLK